LSPTHRYIPRRQLTPVPADGRRRAAEHPTRVHAGADGSRQAVEFGDQHRQAQPVPAREAGWALLGPLQDGELATQQEDLQLLSAVRLEAQRSMSHESWAASTKKTIFPPCGSDAVLSIAGLRAH
jgi:hypothetical protein